MYREGSPWIHSSSTVAIAVAVAAIIFFWFLFKKREIHPPKMPTAIPNNNTKAQTPVRASPISSTPILSVPVFTLSGTITSFVSEKRSALSFSKLSRNLKESKISIPIFSKNYASSKWCLLELAQMVECHANEGQKIFPIFYDVDASDVRNQKGSYEEAFRLHEKKFDEKTIYIQCIDRPHQITQRLETQSGSTRPNPSRLTSQ
ncbi:hypothetical protein LguiB_013940 [Lonicera macranthoides]